MYQLLTFSIAKSIAFKNNINMNRRIIALILVLLLLGLHEPRRHQLLEQIVYVHRGI